MSQTVITFAFEQLKAQEAANGHRVILDEFVFAHVPGLDHTLAIDRAETLPPIAQIVHRQAVNKVGLVNDNAVVYSVTLGTDQGDFDFNWIGLVNKATDTVAMIVHAPTQSKVANQSGQQGNVLTRSFLMEYHGAATETGITTPAETWQIDFTARLGGIDEMQRLINRDHYGQGAFFADAYLVGKNGSQYFVTAGTGYIGGLRAVMPSNQNITASGLPTKVWVDVSYQGNVVSQWETVVKITLAKDNADYTSDTGFKHYVFAVASIAADGTITDLRPKGSLGDQQSNNDFLRKDDNLAALKDKAKSRDNLGLKSAALLDAGTAAGNVMPVGAWGLGSTGLKVTDANLVDKSGFYTLEANKSINTPLVSAYWEMLCIVYDATSAKQLFWQAGAASTKTYVRYRSQGVWGPFQYFYSTENKPTSTDIGLPKVGNFMAVQQGGGIGQGNNKVYLGWGTSGNLKCTVDAYDVGYLYTTTNPPPYPVTSVNGALGAVMTGSASWGSNGYLKDNATGIIIQWGRTPYRISNESGAISRCDFTIAFPTVCLWANVCHGKVDNNTWAPSIAAWVGTTDQWGFYGRFENYGYWMAVGY